MSKIKILQVSATNKKKDGTEMPNNTLKVGLKTTDKDGQEVWINGIVEKEAMTFEVGQEVELEIESSEYGLHFKAPTLADKIISIESRLNALEGNKSPELVNDPKFDFKRPEQPKQAPPDFLATDDTEIKVEDLPV